jgi:putative cardiolipin synthase
VLFADLDVLATGPVVQTLSGDFDRYWASASAYPVDRVVSGAPADNAPTNPVPDDPRAARYVQALRDARFIPELLAGAHLPEWAPVDMVSDDPRKGLGQASEEDLLSHQLRQVLARPPVRSLDLVSPYFVPTASGVAIFQRLAASGVRVRILTNSLEATDVSAVHSGYARHREALLRAGIELYEMRRGGGPQEGSAGLFGSSGSSLHAKTFAVDGERVFVGSMNFDPRSVLLNTELGFIIESATMAEAVGRAFEQAIPEVAYTVRWDAASGRLVWIEQRDGQVIEHRQEPGTGPMKRAWIGLLSVLPIEWLL